jgi:hypothetical protein
MNIFFDNRETNLHPLQIKVNLYYDLSEMLNYDGTSFF